MVVHILAGRSPELPQIRRRHKYIFMLMLVEIIGLLLGGSEATLSATKNTSPNFNELNSFVSRLLPADNKVSGSEWGWDLSAYPNVMEVYQIGPQTIVLAAASPATQLILDPLNGRNLEMNQSQSDTFMRLAEAYKQPSAPYSRTPTPGWLFKEAGSPAAGFSCHPFIDTYYAASRGETGPTRTFYVVTRSSTPKNQRSSVCLEGSMNASQVLRTNLEQGGIEFYGLPDKTLLISVLSPGYLLRLDHALQQRSTLGGKVFVIDANIINAKLNSGAAGNPAFRLEVFQQAVTSHH